MVEIDSNEQALENASRLLKIEWSGVSKIYAYGSYSPYELEADEVRFVHVSDELLLNLASSVIEAEGVELFNNLIRKGGFLLDNGDEFALQTHDKKTGKLRYQEGHPDTRIKIEQYFNEAGQLYGQSHYVGGDLLDTGGEDAEVDFVDAVFKTEGEKFSFAEMIFNPETGQVIEGVSWKLEGHERKESSVTADDIAIINEGRGTPLVLPDYLKQFEVK